MKTLQTSHRLNAVRVNYLLVCAEFKSKGSEKLPLEKHLKPILQIL